MTKETNQVKNRNLKLLMMTALVSCLVGTPRAYAAKSTRQLPDVLSHVLAEPQILFSLSYGSGASEVGLSWWEGGATSISDFGVGEDGSIYVADPVNGKIKQFSRQGKLLMASEDTNHGCTALAVGPSGRVYVLYGAEGNVAVYDQGRKRVQAAETRISAALERLEVQPISSWLSVDKSGQLYLDRDRRIVALSESGEKACIVGRRPLLADEGQGYAFQGLSSGKQAIGKIYNVDGSLVNEFTEDVFGRVQVKIHAADGSVKRQISIPRGEFGNIEKQLPTGGRNIIGVDNRDHFYTRRSPSTIRHIPFKNKQILVHFYAILEYDRNGDFVALRAVLDGTWMDSEHWVKVDKHGNVYWLDFKENHVDVMMSPVASST